MMMTMLTFQVTDTSLRNSEGSCRIRNIEIDSSLT